jgi:NADPH-dependent curcumin reductase CurA
MATSTRVVLASRPDGRASEADFRVEAGEFPAPGEGEIVIRTIYLSLDPYMRGRMNATKSYSAPVEVGAVMEGDAVSEVIESRSDALSPGDIVIGRTGWQTHAVVPAATVRRLDPAGPPISTALGVLGMPGFAAYVGLTEIGRPLPGETFVVAAASGPVGSAAGQMAQIRGARVVGIAGGPQKVAWLRELGFDAALDHRSPAFRSELAEAVPDGIDVYFENVGGAVWDAVFDHLNDFARIPVCGLVSQYDSTGLPSGPDRTPQLMSAINIKRMLVRGFTQKDFLATHHDRFLEEAATWFAEGRLRHREDVVTGLENAPAAFLGMLEGRNFGKLIVEVSPDPTR